MIDIPLMSIVLYSSCLIIGYFLSMKRGGTSWYLQKWGAGCQDNDDDGSTDTDRKRRIGPCGTDVVTAERKAVIIMRQARNLITLIMTMVVSTMANSEQQITIQSRQSTYFLKNSDSSFGRSGVSMPVCMHCINGIQCLNGRH